MRHPTIPRDAGVSFNMTPMIDVVFLLIIFFLVSSHLAKQEAQMELPLPIAETADLPIEQPPHVTLNVLADGRLVLAGRNVSREELRRRLAEALAENESLKLRIRCDRAAPYRTVEPALAAAAAAGVWDVALAVYRAEDVR